MEWNPTTEHNYLTTILYLVYHTLDNITTLDELLLFQYLHFYFQNLGSDDHKYTNILEYDTVPNVDASLLVYKLFVMFSSM